MKPQEFAELYVAYSATYCDGAEPTISSLEDFERKELANYQNKAVESKIDDYHDIADDDDDDDDDMMVAYGCNTPTVSINCSLNNFFISIQLPVAQLNWSLVVFNE